jgi:hypothetical protein
MGTGTSLGTVEHSGATHEVAASWEMPAADASSSISLPRPEWSIREISSAWEIATLQTNAANDEAIIAALQGQVISLQNTGDLNQLKSVFAEVTQEQDTDGCPAAPIGTVRASSDALVASDA